MRWLIHGGTLIYGSGWKEEDILIEDGKIIEIRPAIKAYGEVKHLDATGSYVLPGFIATKKDKQDGKSYGITTVIKSIDSFTEGQDDLQDFVISPMLEDLVKSEIYLLAKRGIKVLQISPGQTKLKKLINEEYWQCRLHDLGMVLSIALEDYPWYESCRLPLVINYGKIKWANRSQLFIHVKEEQAEEWFQQTRHLDALLVQPYWFDSYTCPVPSLSSDEEILHFLLTLTKARSSLPAKQFGIYPQKGSLHIGGDADLMLVDKSSLNARSHPLFSPKYVMIRGELQNQGFNLKAKRTYAYL